MKKDSCNRETEVYSRVVGFYRPTKLWNKGKKDEFQKRKTFSLEKSSGPAQTVEKEVKIG